MHHDITGLNAHFADAAAEEITRWAISTFDDDLILSSSFGADSAVMLHMVTSIKPDTKVVVIDTGYLFRKTHKFMRRLQQRFSLNLHTFASPISTKQMEAEHENLWETDIVAYNDMRKVEPMVRALLELRAKGWLTGRRADQTKERSEIGFVEQSAGILKVNPILRWTEIEISEYMTAHKLPYHPLVRRGFASIGDWHSTKPGKGREGRFGGVAEHTECGLHTRLKP